MPKTLQFPEDSEGLGMTHTNRPTAAVPGLSRSHSACTPKPDVRKDGEEVKLEVPMSARHCSHTELFLKLNSCRLPASLTHTRVTSLESLTLLPKAESKAMV